MYDYNFLLFVKIFFHYIQWMQKWMYMIFK